MYSYCTLYFVSKFWQTFLFIYGIHFIYFHIHLQKLSVIFFISIFSSRHIFQHLFPVPSMSVSSSVSLPRVPSVSVHTPNHHPQQTSAMISKGDIRNIISIRKFLISYIKMKLYQQDLIVNLIICRHQMRRTWLWTRSSRCPWWAKADGSAQNPFARSLGLVCHLISSSTRARYVKESFYIWCVKLC